MNVSAKKYLIVFTIIVSYLLPLEIYSYNLNNIAYAIIWIIIIKLLIKLLRNKNLFAKFTAIIGLILYTLSTSLFLLRFLLCGWHSIGTFYVSKENSSTTLICKTYDCYGTADDCNLYKSRKIMGHIKWVTKFDESPVDTTKWRSIPFGATEFNQL